MEGSGKSLSMGALRSFTRDPKGYVKEGSENEHLSPEGTPLENLEVVLFTGDFERQTKVGSTDDNLVQHICHMYMPSVSKLIPLLCALFNTTINC